MKNIISFFAIVLSSLGLQAQIQVEHIDLNVGDVIYFQMDTSLFELQSPGENLTWDMSNLSSPIIDSLIPIDPANTANASDFPESNMAIGNDSITAYMSATENEFVNLGVSGSMMGYDFLIKFQEADTMIKFPISYGDSRVSYTRGEADIAVANVHHYGRRSLECDAWGTMTTPIGTYDVLRVREEIITLDSVFLLGFFNPNFSRMDTSYKYSFYTNDISIKKALVEITFDPESNMPLYTNWVTFPTQSIVENNAENSLNIYPNPTSDYINILSQEEIQSIKIYNTEGQVLIESNQTLVDVSYLPPAVYFVNIRTKNNITTEKIIVK